MREMKIFVLESNYQHNNSVKNAFNEKVPVFSTKTDSALLKDHKPFFVPDWSECVGMGAHLVVRICRLGKTIPARFASRYYDAVTVGIDFAAVDLLQYLREKGRPWDLAKGFDGSAVIGDWVETAKFRDVQALHFHLDVNGSTVQEGITSDMFCRIDDAIAYLSSYYTLKTGDLLFTGCPAAMRRTVIDDHVTGYIEDRKVLEFNCK